MQCFFNLGRRCVEYDVDYPGNDIKILDGFDNWQDCATVCLNHRGCKYWTYVPDKDHSSYKKCYLKSAKSNVVNLGSVISGAYDCVHDD